MASSPSHRWTFFRAGGFDQVRIETGDDIVHLDTLDQKLWVALSCPTKGLFFDAKTLEAIDTDGDGRIRAPELLTAVRWACTLLKDPQELVGPKQALPLAAIDDRTPDGVAWLAAARRILVLQGRPDSPSITVEDAADAATLFAATRLNGDGVVPADAAETDGVRAAIEAMVASVGSVADRSGKPGVTQDHVDRFFAAAAAYEVWCCAGEDAAVRVLGVDTAAAAGVLATVRSKIDDAFARARLAAFDPRAAEALHPDEKQYQAIAARDLSVTPAELRDLPLARMGAGLPLPFDVINPAWAKEMAAFVACAVTPLLGDRKVLTEAEWQSVQDRLAPWFVWQAAKAGAEVEGLGVARVRELLAGSARQDVTDLIATDRVLDTEYLAIASVEKLLRLHRHLHKLLKSFVSFEDFFALGGKGIFQAGTLYLDQRSCDLCLYVNDVGAHAGMALASHTHLAYCTLSRRGSGETGTIVAAFTGGDSDYLSVGRNGIFYDRTGKDWDATIVRIVENPVSIRQAVWSPYKKFLRMVEQQIVKFAASKEKAVDDAAAAKAGKIGDGSVVAPADPAAPAKKEAFDVARFAGIFAAIGLAIGAIGGMLGAMFGAFFKLAWWQMPLAVLGIMVAISGPSVLIAWMKLRQRNLAPMLDPNGWAVNARARINIPFGGSLTQVAALPRGAKRDLVDPYKKKGHPVLWWTGAIVVALALAWLLGGVECVLPGKLPASPLATGQPR
ncbi:MAG: hypothetical protein ACOYOB_16650 [Myxococcota bacterium]